jgi:hypothetical protein
MARHILQVGMSGIRRSQPLTKYRRTTSRNWQGFTSPPTNISSNEPSRLSVRHEEWNFRCVEHAARGAPENKFSQPRVSEGAHYQ